MSFYPYLLDSVVSLYETTPITHIYLLRDPQVYELAIWKNRNAIVKAITYMLDAGKRSAGLSDSCSATALYQDVTSNLPFLCDTRL